MTTSFRKSSIEDIFTYPFSQPKSSKKLVISVLLMLSNLVIPFLPMFFLLGYMMEIRRRLVLKGSLDLPEWTEWGRYFVDGAKVFAIGFLYMLPIIFLALAGFAVIFFPGLVLDVNAISEGDVSPGIVLITGILSIAGLIVCGLIVILGLILGFVLPAAITHFAVKGRFAAAFNIGEWWAILRNNATDFLIAYIILFVIGILSALLAQILSLTIVLCLFIPFLQSIISVYSMYISSGLFAKAYLTGLEKLEGQKSDQEVEVL